MLARLVCQLDNGIYRRFRHRRGEYLFRAQTVRGKHACRNDAAATSQIARQRAEPQGKAISDTGMTGRFGARRNGLAAFLPQDHAGQLEQRRFRFAEKALQVIQPRRRIGIKIAVMCVDQRRQGSDRQAITRYCLAKARQMRRLNRLSTGDPLKRFAPPLQPNFGKARFANEPGNTGNFRLQRKQREECRTMFGRNEQVRIITRPVKAPDKITPQRLLVIRAGYHCRFTAPRPEAAFSDARPPLLSTPPRLRGFPIRGH
jgi:hypothetical protein